LKSTAKIRKKNGLWWEKTATAKSCGVFVGGGERKGRMLLSSMSMRQDSYERVVRHCDRKHEATKGGCVLFGKSFTKGKKQEKN